jgi:hypothetical protein
MNEYHNNILSLALSVFFFLAYGVIFFVWSWSTLKKHNHKVPWLLKFDILQKETD